MRVLLNFSKGALPGVVLLLSACATQDYASRMYEPNFGLRLFPHFDASVDPDPKAIANGLYTSHPPAEHVLSLLFAVAGDLVQLDALGEDAADLGVVCDRAALESIKRPSCSGAGITG